MLRRPFHKINLKIYLAHIRGNFYDGAIQAAVVDQWCLILGKRGYVLKSTSCLSFNVCMILCTLFVIYSFTAT